MRLLRFLPEEYVIQWLENLVGLSNRKVSNAEALSSCADWQSCLFQLLSEILEKVSAICSGSSESDEVKILNGDTNEKDEHPGDVTLPSLDVQCRKLDLALDLYATLLAHRVREGGDKVSSLGFASDLITHYLTFQYLAGPRSRRRLRFPAASLFERTGSLHLYPQQIIR